MILAQSLPVYLGPVIAGVAALLLGIVIGKALGGKGRKAEPEPASEPEEEDGDDPTAPIAPMIEMARSPHDRHRDLSVGKGLVRQIDFLDAMIKSSMKKRDTDTTTQLELLKKGFIGLLKDCAVEPFDYPPDTEVSAEMRNRIQIVGGSSSDDAPTRIAETVLCGFIYLHGDEDTMIIRKAEVLIK